MTHRMDFDSMAKQCGYDSADALEADFLVNIPRGDVEDMEEAHARFVGNWVDGFLLKQEEVA